MVNKDSARSIMVEFKNSWLVFDKPKVQFLNELTTIAILCQFCLPSTNPFSRKKKYVGNVIKKLDAGSEFQFP